MSELNNNHKPSLCEDGKKLVIQIRTGSSTKPSGTLDENRSCRNIKTEPNTNDNITAITQDWEASNDTVQNLIVDDGMRPSSFGIAAKPTPPEVIEDPFNYNTMTPSSFMCRGNSGFDGPSINVTNSLFGEGIKTFSSPIEGQSASAYEETPFIDPSLRKATNLQSAAINGQGVCTPLKYLPQSVPSFQDEREVFADSLDNYGEFQPKDSKEAYLYTKNYEASHFGVPVETIFQDCAKTIQCHSVALLNSRALYSILETSNVHFPVTLDQKVAACMIYGGIVSRHPIVLKQKLRRLYNLQFSMPILTSLVIATHPELPIDLHPQAYLHPLLVACNIEDEIQQKAEQLISHLHKLDYRETGMSQQWAVAALFKTIKVLKKSPCSLPKLRSYAATQKMLNYTMTRLSKVPTNDSEVSGSQ